MSITTLSDGRICQIQISSLPAAANASYILRRNQDAYDIGAPLLANLMNAPGIESIDLNTSGTSASIHISLQAGFAWNDIASRGGKTREQIVKDFLHKKIFDEKVLLVAPKVHNHQDHAFKDNVLKTINDIVTQKKIPANEHGGALRFVDYRPDKKTLVLEFSGTCSTGCLGSRQASESVVLTLMRQAYPREVSRVEFVNK